MSQLQDELQNRETNGEPSQITSGTNDILTQALGTEEHRGHVRGMGKYISPHQYFYLPKTVKEYMDKENKKFDQRFNKLEGALNTIQRTLNNASEGASCQMWDNFEDLPPEELPVSFGYNYRFLHYALFQLMYCICRISLVYLQLIVSQT